MKILGHATITITIGSILYNYSHSFYGFLWLLITGIFLDLDHYIDYTREHGVSFNLKKVHDTCLNHVYFKKMFLILHSYELVILFWLLILIFDMNIIWKYAAIGLTLHLLTDQMTNPVVAPAYFLCFRMVKNFETNRLFLDKGVKHAYWHR